MTAPVFLEDSSGRQITLGAELGRGGEGAVYEVREDPSAAAKIYQKPLGLDHVAKLNAMAHVANGALLKLAAWPTGTLLRGGQPVGFLMPKLSGYRPAFELYGPKLRLQQFPTADWRFLIRAATNTARAFSVVHSGGHVIGDVNHGNLIVGRDATVRLIDCDSFQISDGRKTWFCEVGVGTHQPPEMQGRSYAGFTRTPNHDAFGLAVLIFQMLCLGRHPYSGRYLGPGDSPAIEDAIREFRYAYGGDTRTSLIAPPPGSLPMEALTSQIRQMFEAAFLQGGPRAARPNAILWADALRDLEERLRKCSFVGSHYYLNSLPACPWCELEARSGAALFPVTFVSGAQGPDGFMLLWQQVEAMRLPGPRPPLPSLPKAFPHPTAQATGRRLRVIAAALGAMFLVGWAALSLILDSDGKPGAIFVLMATLATVLLVVRCGLRAGFQTKLSGTTAEWNRLRKEWANRDHDPANVRAELDRIKQEYDVVQADRAAKLRQLHENRRASQLKDHLDRFQIAAAKIRGVGPAKAATLQSYSIETAADVAFHAVVAVPGFGPKTAQNLVAWRIGLENSFRFDPRRGVPQNEIAAVENATGIRRRQLEQRLSVGVADLRASILTEQSARERLLAKFNALGPVHAQAVADSWAATIFGGS